jgi:hypothetical protein
MIRHILRKDWNLLWPMVAVVAAIQIGYEWAIFSSGLFGENPGAEALLRPLTLAWFAGIAALTVAVVHQDPIPGADQDWLIRPLNRTQLLLAKMIFLALVISAPMFMMNLTHALAMRMPVAASLIAVLSKELFIFACFIVPVAALAATTRNMTELMVLAATLVLIYAVSVSLSAFLLGADWCPTCHTGMAWLQHLGQHAGILVGAAVVLFLQYYRRQSTVARGLAIVGTVSLVFIQLPWNTAFHIEQWLSESSGDAAAVALELGKELPTQDPASGGNSADSRQTTQMLLRGQLDQAFVNLHRRARPGGAPVTIDLPVRIIGISGDELLLADRSQILLFGEDGRLLYRGKGTGASAGLLAAEGGEVTSSGLSYQAFELPGNVYRNAAARTVRLQIEYTLTLVKVRAEHKIAALDGELRSADLGLCATRLDRNNITVHCKSISQAPFCYSGTLYGADGRHDPEVFQCAPDYRHHWPALIDVLNYSGIDLPVRDPYAAAPDGPKLETSHVLLKIYGELAHFKRTLTVANFQPERWRDKAR